MKFGNIGNAVIFPADRPEMPPPEKIGRVRVIRLPGTLASRECLGVGFLRKNRHDDLVNRRFPNFVLVLVLRGRGVYADGRGREFPLRAGSFFVRLPDLEHSNYVDENSDYLECYLEIGPRLFQALNDLNLLLTAPPVHEIDLAEAPELPRRIWHLGWMLSHASDDGLGECLAEMTALFGAIRKLGKAMEPGEKYRDLVALACRELSRNFTEEFSLQKFCRKHSVGYENFRKLFRVRTGMAPWSYRIRCKMENAVMLLRQGDLTLKEIAEQLGYHSSYEFSAQFKRKFGIAPMTYRRMH